jgi:hypothetical protein
LRLLGWPERVAYVAAGFLLFIPASLLPGDNVSTYLGLALTAALLGRDYLKVRRKLMPAGAPSASPAAE